MFANSGIIELRGILPLGNTRSRRESLRLLRYFPAAPTSLFILSERTPDSCGELLRNPSGGYFPNENISDITRRRSV
jgi:hypothetical protein